MAKKKATPALAAAQSGPSKTVAELLDAVTESFMPLLEGGSYYGRRLEDTSAGKTILAQDRETQAAVVRGVLDRLAELEPRIAEFRSKLQGNYVHNPHIKPGWFPLWNRRWLLEATLRGLLRRELPLSEADLIRLVEWPVTSSNHIDNFIYPLAGIAGAVDCFGTMQITNDEAEARTAPSLPYTGGTRRRIARSAFAPPCLCE